MSIEAMKLALAALETCHIRSVSEWSVEDITPKNVTAAIAALRTAIQQAEAQQVKTTTATSDLHIGVCITDGVLYATVMQHESNGAATVVATAEIDAASLHGRDCIGKMKPATGEPIGYMNEGHIHELAMGRIPYGYVYPEAGTGASTAVYTHAAPSVSATGESIGQVFYAADGDDETGVGYHMKPYVHWFSKALAAAADTKLYTRPVPSLPDSITPPTEDGTEYDFASGHAAKQDAAALNWIERQYLEELGMGLVIDAPNDGKYYVCGDSGTTHYGKTLREAVASAIAEVV